MLPGDIEGSFYNAFLVGGDVAVGIVVVVGVEREAVVEILAYYVVAVVGDIVVAVVVEGVAFVETVAYFVVAVVAAVVVGIVVAVVVEDAAVVETVAYFVVAGIVVAEQHSYSFIVYRLGDN